MACKRCEADPQPSDCGSPRRCAFDEAGLFTPENWNCATLNLLADERGRETEHGDDESIQVCYGAYSGGWIVLSRYKRRGRCSSAVHVGDFFPPEIVTIEMVERFIAGEEEPEREEDVDVNE